MDVEARVAKAREEVDRLFGGAARVDKKLEEEMGWIRGRFGSRGICWWMWRFPPMQQIGQDEAEEVQMQAEDEAVAGYWDGRGSQSEREDSPERSPFRTPAGPPSPVTDLEEAVKLQGLLDDDMDESDLEGDEAGAGCGGSRWS